jgi:hypothetical protein
MVIKKLSPGMTVYDVRRSRGNQFYNGKWQTWSVRIIEVDAENEKVLASWNSNKPEWYHKKTWSKWRLKKPNW